MAANLQVDIDVMRSAQARFAEASATARSIGTSVQSVGGQIGGVWDGQASMQYQNTLIAWSQQYGRVVTALEGLRDSLGISISKLQQAELDATQHAGIDETQQSRF